MARFQPSIERHFVFIYTILIIDPEDLLRIKENLQICLNKYLSFRENNIPRLAVFLFRQNHLVSGQVKPCHFFNAIDLIFIKNDLFLKFKLTALPA